MRLGCSARASPYLDPDLVKRKDLIRQLAALGAELVREGASHTVYRNPRTGRNIPVPRHAEIAEGLARKILRDAEAAPAD